MALRPFRFLILAAALLVAACGGTTVTPRDRNPQGFAAWSDAAPPYLIGPGDHLSVMYRKTPEMDETAVVLPDGRITLKTTGVVSVMDQTVEEATATLTEKARKLLRDPIVTVAVADAVSAKVYVDGAVARPGAYPINGRIGVMEAIAQANGFRDEALLSSIALIRRSPRDTPMLKVIDLQGFLEGGAAAKTADVPLAAGDIVFVPRSSIGELNLWIEQFVNRALPFGRAFSYTLNRDL
ncbi:polysaccharide biosynthesis/export family protein [Oleispirillum naphthae]|uniref:polysaccharide biosynthesis/export family protein n=1 Tax=Oleispirillum naphthae TaxID=2838853 RepID=UPI00308221E1